MESIDAVRAAGPVMRQAAEVEADRAPVETPAFLLNCTDCGTPLAAVHPTDQSRNEFGGRCFDLVVVSLLILLVLPLLAVCALTVRLDGPGPILFRHTRMGRNGREFQCLKFRTMVQDADAAFHQLLSSDPEALNEWLAVQKLKNDPRVTSCGQFLRRYCLDELPQLFNVLAGDMSVVGPRPIVAAEISRYGASYAAYCSVNPGMTGLWQVSGRHSLSYAQRVRLDAEYAQSKSVAADLLILWRTVPIVLFGLN